mmetsp:Transcript_16798/g.43464  ORF Transcript_16798/g.43464 Transcript_16798/m.43464 type:complete len:88 (+) Transcript_16798:518-781(+)
MKTEAASTQARAWGTLKSVDAARWLWRHRGVEGKILASKYSRENDLPHPGICFGFQVAMIDYVRAPSAGTWTGWTRLSVCLSDSHFR